MACFQVNDNIVATTRHDSKKQSNAQNFSAGLPLKYHARLIFGQKYTGVLAHLSCMSNEQ